jgi:hypothetical protein
LGREPPLGGLEREPYILVPRRQLDVYGLADEIDDGGF